MSTSAEVLCPCCGSVIRIDVEPVVMTVPKPAGDGLQLALEQGNLRAVPSADTVLVVRRAIEEVAKRTGVTLEDLRGRRGTAKVSRIRQAAMWAAYQQPGVTYALIGRELARDHSTILHGVRAHEARREAAVVEAVG